MIVLQQQHRPAHEQACDVQSLLRNTRHNENTRTCMRTKYTRAHTSRCHTRSCTVGMCDRSWKQWHAPPLRTLAAPCAQRWSSSRSPSAAPRGSCTPGPACPACRGGGGGGVHNRDTHGSSLRNMSGKGPARASEGELRVRMRTMYTSGGAPHEWVRVRMSAGTTGRRASHLSANVSSSVPGEIAC